MSNTFFEYKRLRPDVQPLAFATFGAAGLDLRWHKGPGDNTFNWGLDKMHQDGVWLGQRGSRTQTFSTGIAVAIPPGCVGLVFSRSGHGFNYDVRLANCVGVIDSDYRGEILVKLTQDCGDSLWVSHGDRIAQLLILKCRTVMMEVAELSETARGTGGFGSTGVT